MGRSFPFWAAVTLSVLARPSSASEDLFRARTFEVIYRATVREVPEGAKALDLWLPMPSTDANQTVHRITIDAPGPITIGREPEFGNKILHLRTERPGGAI